jgi:hypothetical protein
LFDLYSPELLTEQQNYIYLITNDSENTSIISIKTKLLLYGMSNNQIISLAAAKKEQILSFRFIVQLMELLMEHSMGNQRLACKAQQRQR